jgi:hypothetical protein
MAEGFLLGPDLLARTRRAIETVEGGVVGSGFRRIPTVLEGEDGRSQKVFRICTFTGSWAIGATKTVQLKYVPGATNTVVVTNIYCGLNPGNVATDISIAKEGTAWFLVQVDITKQPGYSGSGTHVLTIQNGILRWIGTTAC